jgi:hypothetical protein
MQCHSTTLQQAENAHIVEPSSANVSNVVSGLLLRIRRMFIVELGAGLDGVGA